MKEWRGGCPSILDLAEQKGSCCTLRRTRDSAARVVCPRGAPSERLAIRLRLFDIALCVCALHGRYFHRPVDQPMGMYFYVLQGHLSRANTLDSMDMCVWVVPDVHLSR